MNPITDIKIHPLNNPTGSMLAFASCVIATGIGPFVFRGMRIMNGKFGLFVSMPSEKDKQNKYHDHYFALDKETRGKLQDAILEVYHGGASQPYANNQQQEVREEVPADGAIGGGPGF